MVGESRRAAKPRKARETSASRRDHLERVANQGFATLGEIGRVAVFFERGPVALLEFLTATTRTRIVSTHFRPIAANRLYRHARLSGTRRGARSRAPLFFARVGLGAVAHL